MLKFLSCLLSVLLLLVTQSFAKEKSNSKRFQFTDSQIYSLSKRSENSFDVASSIYILTSKDIRRSGATSIPEVLRLVPGLQVARIDGNKWAISARGFNAQYSNKLLIMIDGRTVYTPLFSGSFWEVHDYILEDIARIEVIRGSGGTIWGSNAVNGVINIITKKATETEGLYLSSIAGNKDEGIFEARYGGETESKDNYRIYAKIRKQGNLHNVENSNERDDGYETRRAGFNYELKVYRK